LYSGTSDPAERIEIRGVVARDLQTMMKSLGHYRRRVNGTYDPATREALRAFTGKENLEDRVDLDHGTIDPPALAYLVRKFGRARPAQHSSTGGSRRRAARR
jgi:peptidoglycan hydrolase-like protein with peptidoglycan-binding domain